MPYRPRLLALLVVLAVTGLPAVALRAACAGRSCDGDDGTHARVPFCPLPAALRTAITAGFREGRSPDVLGVTARGNLVGGAGVGGPQPDTAWPTLEGGPTTAVPIAFAGAGVTGGSPVPDGTRLDAIAPTLSEILGFHRPHPEVRSGAPVPGVSDGDRPALVLEIAWKGVGAEELKADPNAWPFLRSLIASGAGTLRGEAGSLPLDPAATLTTIGTGGPPSQHGITGTLVRNDAGQVVRAWGPGSPPSVIATLPDDLDWRLQERPMVGLVATDASDRGLIGGTWYVPHDRDDVVVDANDPVAAVARMLRTGYGADAVPDILGVVLDGPVHRLDGLTRVIVGAARTATGDATTVVAAGTGSIGQPGDEESTAHRLVSDVDRAVGASQSIVEAAVAGGLFLDQHALAEEGITSQSAVDALLGLSGDDGERLMDDAFQGFAVSFARYC